jgi:hypothetical protein
MNKDLVAPLIKQAIALSPRPKPTFDSNVHIGQIRVLANSTKSESSRYVLVLNINPIRKIATVVLLNNLTNLATDRDFVLRRSESVAAFDLTILSDFMEMTDYSFIDKGPLVGSLCSICSRIIYEAKKSPIEEEPVFPGDHACLQKGNFRIQIADSTWYMRNSEFEIFRSICEVPDERESLVREGAFLQRYKDQEEYISASKNNFSTELILLFEDSTLDLLRN